MNAAASSLNTHVLVLNKLWMAVRVTDAKRALSMLFCSTAEVIHSGDGSYWGYDFDSWTQLSQARDLFYGHEYEWVRTVHLRIAVPKVIRLPGYDRLPSQGVKLNRRNIFARDGNLCQYCGKRFATPEMSLDHVVPRSCGGATTWQNLVCCCVSCNARKGGRTPSEAGMKLVRKPAKPRRNPTISLRLGHDKYASWRAFLENAYWSVELK